MRTIEVRVMPKFITTFVVDDRTATTREKFMPRVVSGTSLLDMIGILIGVRHSSRIEMLQYDPSVTLLGSGYLEIKIDIEDREYQELYLLCTAEEQHAYDQYVQAFEDLLAAAGN